jgi:ribonuclease E
MEKRMLINAAQTGECRVAIAEGETLVDFNIETTSREKSKGNVYTGTVTHIEPSFQAAFVDYGAKRHGFLSLSEINPRYYNKRASTKEKPRVQDVLIRGQKLLVQVVKEEMANKGAALTTNISLPGRYLVLMPASTSHGVSRKIENEGQRERLVKIVEEFDLPEKMGFIVRTAGLDKNKPRAFYKGYGGSCRRQGCLSPGPGFHPTGHATVPTTSQTLPGQETPFCQIQSGRSD